MELLSDDIWAAAKKAKGAGKTMAAVAYVTADRLGLTEGDVLICDASEPTVACGATSARLLSKLVEAGVKVFSLENLHAKIVRMPDAVMLGSSNMTRRTEVLEEVAALSSDPRTQRQADVIFRQLLAKRNIVLLDRAKLRDLLAIPVMRNGGSGTKASLRPPEARLWITLVNPLSAKVDASVNEQVGKALNDGQPYEGPTLVLTAKDLRYKQVNVGHYMIEVDWERRARVPYEITGVVKVRVPERGRLVTGHAVTCQRQVDRFVPWDSIRGILKDAGVWTRPTRPALLALDSAVERRVRAVLKAAKA